MLQKIFNTDLKYFRNGNPILSNILSCRVERSFYDGKCNKKWISSFGNWSAKKCCYIRYKRCKKLFLSENLANHWAHIVGWERCVFCFCLNACKIELSEIFWHSGILFPLKKVLFRQTLYTTMLPTFCKYRHNI